jgi:hypothetical protein
MLPKRKIARRIAWLGLVALLLALAWVPAALPAGPVAPLCTLASGQSSLAPETRHGLAAHLRQYPDLDLATPAQRASASRLLEKARTATARWQNVKAANARGFGTRLARRTQGDEGVGYLHAEHRKFSSDRRFLDPRRPEALIYATEPGHRPVLIGAMFSVPRGVRGPTPGGPIDRWHSHIVCMKGHARGLATRADGTCATGATRTQGSEMLHLWFTSDLRSAFAVHAPVPELCRDGLLTPEACRSGVRRHEM